MSVETLSTRSVFQVHPRKRTTLTVVVGNERNTATHLNTVTDKFRTVTSAVSR
jgi:hypothetical protein